MRRINYLIKILIAVFILVSCRKIEKLPSIPHIEFTSFTILDTTTLLGKYKAGRLKFYFEDGDGDIGLDAPLDKNSDTTNMFITLFRKKGSSFIPSSGKDPLLPYSEYRIPYMERLGQNKILKGTISITFLYLNYSKGDTIKYDFYLKDRALNESNVSSTSEIVISVNKIYTN